MDNNVANSSKAVWRKIRGEIFVKVGEMAVPLGKAACLVGKHDYVRSLIMPCQCCGELEKLRNLNDGGYCEPCIQADIDEQG